MTIAGPGVKWDYHQEAGALSGSATVTRLTIDKGVDVTLWSPFAPLQFKAPFAIAPHDVLTVDFADNGASGLNATAISVFRGSPSFSSSGPYPLDHWSFGTTVRNIEFGTIGTVLTDDGVLTKVLMLVSGEVVETGHSIWEPDRA